jgi:hypothetical protein
MNKYISKKKAKSLGLKRYFTGEPCIHGHLCERYVACSICVECKKISRKKDRINNAERIADYRKTNANKIAEQKKNYQKENAEKIALYNKQYQQENRSRCNFNLSKSQLKERMLSDIYDYEIIKVYEEAQRISLETGAKHNVRHIIPLNGEKVSGLHVPTNLKIVPLKD